MTLKGVQAPCVGNKKSTSPIFTIPHIYIFFFFVPAVKAYDVAPHIM